MRVVNGCVVWVAFCVLAGAAATTRAEDAITLVDGRKLTGTITKEEADTVYIKLSDGDERGILRSRITRLERHYLPGQKPPGAEGAGPKSAVAEPAAPDPSKAVAVLADQIRNLGSPSPPVRKAVLDKLQSIKAEAVPVMLALLQPKLDTDEWTRIGILRALVELAPLDETASKTLAFAALFDAYPEVRREAAISIRKLRDDGAVRELIKLANTEDGNLRRRLAVVVHEVDDPRILAALIRSIPQPSVTANQGPVTGGEAPAYVLPVGPGGLNIPIYLPKQEVAGVASDIGSPIAELMKLVAGKDLGSLPFAWANWFREKLGDISASDRDSYREHRSLRNRIGSPGSGSGGAP